MEILKGFKKKKKMAAREKYSDTLTCEENHWNEM